MRSTSTSKILLLWNFLKEKEYTKKELIEKFTENNIKISERTLNYYLSKLKNYTDIKIKTIDKLNYYYVKTKKPTLELNDNDKLAIIDIKNLLKNEKNYRHIREAIRLFLKISFFIEDLEERSEFLYFDYYSNLNWYLIKELEKHCQEKNIIKIDYILPSKSNKFITIHADEITQSMTSDRLYLKGFIENSNNFSILPIDKIFKIEKVIRKNVRFEKTIDTITYVTSREKIEELGLDTQEKIINEKNERTLITRPQDDNFYLSQRLFNFCPDLYYVSDEKIKNEIQKKLKIMKESYDKKINI